MTKLEREERKKKEEAQILKRSDKEYLEIEQFTDYEFSNAIACEMLKRDPSFQTSLTRFIAFYQNHKEKIEFDHSDSSEFETSFDYRLHRRAQNIFTYWFQATEYIYWIEPMDIFYLRQESVIIEMLERYVILTAEVDEEGFVQKGSIEQDNVIFTSTVTYNNPVYFTKHPDPTYDEIVQAIRRFDIDPCQIKGSNEVTVSFSRPKLSIPSMYNKNFKLEFNLSLPESELVAYLQHIKQAYDSSRNDILTVTEMLGVSLLGEGFIESEAELLYKKDKRKKLAEKFADLFFIFDCKEEFLSMEYAIEQINHYWVAERKSFPDKFQEKTYKRYLKLSRDFILNRKYKSFLIDQ